MMRKGKGYIMKILICDDDIRVLDQYSKLLYKMECVRQEEVEILKCDSGKHLVQEFKKDINRAEIILLDIRMPVMDGIEAASALRKMNCKSEIIFLTQVKDRMLDAFDVSAFHYIVKDETSTEVIDEILSRAIYKIVDKHREMMTFSCAGENIQVFVDGIKYFEVLQRIITVHYGTNKRFEFYSRLGKLEELLYKKDFVRIHRAYLVSLHHIESITFKELKMKDGSSLPIGRNYYADLKERFFEENVN